MEKLFLCVDIGTSSLKAGALTAGGKTLHKVRISFEGTSFSSKNISMAGKWIEAFNKARAALEAFFPGNKKPFEAICISGNGPSLVCVTDEKNLLESPVLLWNDKVNEEAQAKAEELLKKTEGCHSIFLPRLLLLKYAFPQIFSSSKYIISGPEFLSFYLTGKAVTFLPEKRWRSAYWSDEVLQTSGFTSEEIKKLPEFTESGTLAGTDLNGVPVAAGLPDFASALLGTLTVKPGRIYMRSGTSEGLNLCTREPLFSKNVRTLPSVINDLWNAGILFQNSLTTQKELEDGYKELLETARSKNLEIEDTIKICGGQVLNAQELFTKEKAFKAVNKNASLMVMPENDSELTGDLILCLKALGYFPSILEAALSLEK